MGPEDKVAACRDSFVGCLDVVPRCAVQGAEAQQKQFTRCPAQEVSREEPASPTQWHWWCCLRVGEYREDLSGADGGAACSKMRGAVRAH